MSQGTVRHLQRVQLRQVDQQVWVYVVNEGASDSKLGQGIQTSESVPGGETKGEMSMFGLMLAILL